MTAVIYARYSSDSQREESIDGQLRECMAFAERQGISVKAPWGLEAFKLDDKGKTIKEIVTLLNAKGLTFFYIYAFCVAKTAQLGVSYYKYVACTRSSWYNMNVGLSNLTWHIDSNGLFTKLARQEERRLSS